MKKILIIGWSGTIGLELVKAHKNDDIILAGRTIFQNGPFIYLDLSSIESICQGIKKLAAYSFDLIYVNSGMYDRPSSFEKHLMVNAIGPYLLMKALCKRSSATKIIVTSSVSILHAKQDMNPSNRKHYYRNTKLIEWLLFEKLKKQFPMHTIVYAHPGITYSNISKELHGLLVSFWIKKFAQQAKSAVEPLLLAGKEEPSKMGWFCPKYFFSLFGHQLLKK